MFYNTGLLRKTTTLPNKVGLQLSRDRGGNGNYGCFDHVFNTDMLLFIYFKTLTKARQT